MKDVAKDVVGGFLSCCCYFLGKNIFQKYLSTLFFIRNIGVKNIDFLEMI